MPGTAGCVAGTAATFRYAEPSGGRGSGSPRTGQNDIAPTLAPPFRAPRFVENNFSGGNVLVPTGFDPVLHSALKSFGQLATAVRTFRTDNGGPVKVALESDEFHG